VLLADGWQAEDHAGVLRLQLLRLPQHQRRRTAATQLHLIESVAW
jgi:hypothetical protein